MWYLQKTYGASLYWVMESEPDRVLGSPAKGCAGDTVDFEYPAFLVTTLSFSKFTVAGSGWTSDGENIYKDLPIEIRCTVCGQPGDITYARLDELVEWAEQHDCPIPFKGPP